MKKRLSIVASLSALLVVAGTSVAFLSAQTARKVFVSVVGKDGAPVKDITAADLDVKEGGKAVEVTVKPATDPLRVALLIADGGTGAFQNVAGGFINGLRGAEFKLVDVAQQPQTVVDYTSSIPDLSAGIQKLGRRTANRSPGQVLEAILDATKTIAADGKRPVIVVLRVGGEANSSLQATSIRDAMRKAGARLYIVSPPGGGGLGAGGMGVAQTSSKMDDQRANQENMDNAAQLNQTLDDGSKETGGRHDHGAPAIMGKMLEQITAELQSQCEVSYTLPSGTKPSDRLQVVSKRKDTKVYAPARIAN